MVPTATGSPLLWPAPESLLLKFVAHHLWDRTAPPDKLVDPYPLAGLRRFLRRALAQVGAAPCGQRQRPAAATKEQKGCHR